MECRKNPTAREARAALADFGAAVKMSGEACLFAFLGHSCIVSKGDDRGAQLLLCRDADTSRIHDSEPQSGGCTSSAGGDFGWLRLDDVRSSLAEVRRGDAEPAATIFLLDCCRDPSHTPESSQPVATGLLGGLPNACSIFSTSAGEVASDGDVGRGSPFMTRFLEFIRRGEPVQTVLLAINREMGWKQIPVYESSLGIFFYFGPSKLLAPAASLENGEPLLASGPASAAGHSQVVPV